MLLPLEKHPEALPKKAMTLGVQGTASVREAGSSGSSALHQR
jgi:hypothetical protein